MPEIIDNTEPKALPPPQPARRWSRGAMSATALVGILIAGAALGAGGTRLVQRFQPQSVTLLQPMLIGNMQPDRVVAIKGEVAEIFGNKFVMQDDSGRALVDTGPRGEDRKVASKGEALTVQGRFDHGVIHAQVVMHSDGRNEAFGPPHGPPPRGPDDGPGLRADRGPPPPPGDRAGPDAGAPPPAR